MRRFQEAFNVLTTLRSEVRGFKTKVVKSAIGDSINNNRTVTVNQAIRFAKKRKLRSLALILSITSSILEEKILESRGNRTDAIDLNELVTTYRNVVMNGKQLRRQIGVALSKVG